MEGNRPLFVIIKNSVWLVLEAFSCWMNVYNGITGSLSDSWLRCQTKLSLTRSPRNRADVLSASNQENVLRFRILLYRRTSSVRRVKSRFSLAIGKFSNKVDVGNQHYMCRWGCLSQRGNLRTILGGLQIFFLYSSDDCPEIFRQFTERYVEIETLSLGVEALVSSNRSLEFAEEILRNLLDQPERRPEEKCSWRYHLAVALEKLCKIEKASKFNLKRT